VSWEARIKSVEKQLENVMTKQEELAGKLASAGVEFEALKARVTVDIAAQAAEIQKLKDQVAAGEVVTAAQFDALLASADNLIASIKPFDPIPDTAPEPEPEPVEV
jgi:predicted  nucleic acid-binding Zn-ribbon protein